LFTRVQHSTGQNPYDTPKGKVAKSQISISENPNIDENTSRADGVADVGISVKLD
jgi:hypothetical protein